MPPQAVKELNVEDIKYKEIQAMAENGETLFPDLINEAQLKKVKVELAALLEKRPHGYYAKAATLQEDVTVLNDIIHPQRDKMKYAMDIMEESRSALSLYEGRFEFRVCLQWEPIYNAARKVLHPYLCHLQDEKDEKDEKVKAATIRKAMPTRLGREEGNSTMNDIMHY